MPQISLWPTAPSSQHPPSSSYPMNTTIDLAKLSAAAADHAFDYDRVMSRLQLLALPSEFEPKNTFALQGHVLDALPASSMSNSDSTASASHEAAFFATRSRVVRLYNLPSRAESVLSTMFLPQNPTEHGRIPVPATTWELREEFLAGRRDSVWAVFRTHEEAAAALELSGRAMSVATALESDLEPFHKLHRVVLRNSASSSPAPTALSSSRTHTLDLPPPLSLPLSDLRTTYSSMPEISTTGEYTLSSNPPNPKTSFRLGDWICSSPNCAAHNFGRNLACIGCGCPRSNHNGNASGSFQQHQQPSNPSNARAQPSPRFNTMSSNVTYYSSAPPPSQNCQVQQQHHQQHQQQLHHHQQQLHHQPQPQHHHHHQQQQQHLSVQQHTVIGHSQPQPQPSPFGPSPSSSLSSQIPHCSNPPKSSHPLLTPSGRAFAIGGKVQNISSDPLSPCIMYWPDNEPLPEQGQIRPSNLAGVAQPPILNTGNRGPISHQPGDWICQKCNYLNWRRRKVCQTCLPYAEGNGDSISAAVQAERIALLTSVLSQTQLNSGNLNSPSAAAANLNANLNLPQANVSAQALRSHSLTPPQARRPFIDLSPPQQQAQTVTRLVHRSHSHYTLGQQFAQQAHQQQAQHQHQQASAAATHPHYTASSPIYQTSGNPHRQPSPLYSTGPDVHRTTTNLSVNAHTHMNHLTVNGSHGVNANPNANANVNVHPHAQNIATVTTANVNLNAYAHAHTPSNNTNSNDFNLPSVSVHAPAPLLPSFLQDIVQSPALSPTSTTTSSADLSSMEEYEEFSSGSPQQRSMFPRARGDSGSSDMHSPIANIWRLDGEESKSLSAFALPDARELAGGGELGVGGGRGAGRS